MHVTSPHDINAAAQPSSGPNLNKDVGTRAVDVTGGKCLAAP